MSPSPSVPTTAESSAAELRAEHAAWPDSELGRYHLGYLKATTLFHEIERLQKQLQAAARWQERAFLLLEQVADEGEGSRSQRLLERIGVLIDSPETLRILAGRGG